LWPKIEDVVDNEVAGARCLLAAPRTSSALSSAPPRYVQMNERVGIIPVPCVLGAAPDARGACARRAAARAGPGEKARGKRKKNGRTVQQSNNV
jgi:hypothetical protein